MSDEKPKSGLPKVKVDVGLGAKLNIDVKTEVPAEVSGKALSTFTDLVKFWFSPSELKPELLRLQKEEVALKVALLMQERLAVESSTEGAPTKVLVPLFETASLEDPEDDYFIEKWAELGASCVKAPKAQHRYLVSLLGQLSGLHVKVLEACALHNPVKEDTSLDVEFALSAGLNHSDFEIAANICLEISLPDGGLEAIKENQFFQELLKPGALIWRFALRTGDLCHEPAEFNLFQGLGSQEELDLVMEVLASLGLIRKADFHNVRFANDRAVDIKGIALTTLGVALVSSCVPDVVRELERLDDAPAVGQPMRCDGP